MTSYFKPFFGETDFCRRWFGLIDAKKCEKCPTSENKTKFKSNQQKPMIQNWTFEWEAVNRHSRCVQCPCTRTYLDDDAPIHLLCSRPSPKPMCLCVANASIKKLATVFELENFRRMNIVDCSLSFVIQEWCHSLIVCKQEYIFA